MSGSRWIFAEDHSAIQVCNIVRLTIGKTGLSNRPFSVMAHLVNVTAPVTVAQFDSETEAREGIKDMVVGREYCRS